MSLASLNYNRSVYMLTHFKRFSLNTNLIIKVVCFSFPLNGTPLLVWVSSFPWTWVFHKEEGEILRWWALSASLGTVALEWNLKASDMWNQKSQIDGSICSGSTGLVILSGVISMAICPSIRARTAEPHRVFSTQEPFLLQCWVIVIVYNASYLHVTFISTFIS